MYILPLPWLLLMLFGWLVNELYEDVTPEGRRRKLVRRKMDERIKQYQKGKREEIQRRHKSYGWY